MMLDEPRNQRFDAAHYAELARPLLIRLRKNQGRNGINLRRPLSERSPRHRTFTCIEILVIAQDHAEAAHRKFSASILDDLLQVEILDREVILVESKLSAHRGEAGLAHCVPHRIL